MWGLVLHLCVKYLMSLSAFIVCVAAKLRMRLAKAELPKLYVEGSIPFARSMARKVDAFSAHTKRP
jgi:hypothetical protein